ncbi:hypothetical protein [Halorientalis marina]|jgi:hypothetical protein|uniref:hypothetical protein n=1 Tax=Halorientalis marina TaxID=2931976 RepID=UPI001FF65CA4|nr:hypothetical protein [Halorientalis marina]
MNIPSIRGNDDEGFDDYDEFVPEHVPEPGEFLRGNEILAGDDHLDFHELTRELFEERGVYDITFGYNLARLNLDQRHPDAGFRYAEAADEEGVLLAEFTPTTEFCPQSDTLTKGAFRAWNGLRERHDYDAVWVRVDPMHHESHRINGELRALQESFEDSGEVPDPRPSGPEAGVPTERGYDKEPDAPF